MKKQYGGQRNLENILSKIKGDFQTFFSVSWDVLLKILKYQDEFVDGCLADETILERLLR